MKVCELLDDPARRQAMGTIGRRKIESELAWHHQVPHLLAAYELAFADHRRLDSRRS
jgi:hypothetical protein